MNEAEHGGSAAPIEQAKRDKQEALHAAHYEIDSGAEQSAAAPTYPYSVLTVGTELAVLSPDSPVRKRIFAYGRHFKSMHVILMCGPTGQGDVVDGNVTVYPTNSWHKVTRFFDALGMGKAVDHIDIVSAQDPFETGLIAWLIARHHKAPLHVQVHTDFLSPEYAAHSVINRIRVWIAGFIIARAARIRVVSKIVGQSITDVYHPKAPVTVLPIYIDLARFREAKIDASMPHRFMNFPKRALVVSRLEPEKNVARAIQAFKDAAPESACLIICGEGSEYTTLERMVTKLGLDARVFFEGHQDPAPYYALCDILLVTSEYEGYGQVIIEALAAQKPVLSTDVGIAKESGAIIASPEEFAAALRAWFQSGPSTGVLTNYPYSSFDDYVRQYCDDIAASKGKIAER